MLNRADRDEMADLIRRYCAEELWSSALDNRIEDLAHESEDYDLFDVFYDVWLTYDDFIDHPIHVPKPCWDYLQRLLLFLDSDGEIVEEHSRRWTWRQPLAAAGVGAFGFAAATVIGSGWSPGELGWIGAYYLTCVPLAGLCHLIDTTRERDRANRRADWLLTPFSSVSEILGTRRQVPGFRKMRYRPEIGQRPPLRTPMRERLMYVPGQLMSVVFAPLALLGRAFPEEETKRRVELPPQPGSDTPRRSPNPCPAAG